MEARTSQRNVADDLFVLLDPSDEADLPTPGPNDPRFAAVVAWARLQPLSEVVTALNSVLTYGNCPQQILAMGILRKLGVPCDGAGYGAQFHWVTADADGHTCEIKPTIQQEALMSMPAEENHNATTLDSTLIRHVSHRCTNMQAHHSGRSALPVPCPDCFSIESFWHQIPYETDSQRPATHSDVVPLVPPRPPHPSYHGEEISKGDDVVGTPASLGMFKVVGVDTFDRDPDSHWVYAEWPTVALARECADAHGGPMLKTHVYDDRGRHIYEAGTV